MTLWFLPLYIPELMPIQRLWRWMKEHDLSNWVHCDEAEIDAARVESGNRLTR